MSTVATFTVPLLAGSNFNNWKFRMLSVLEKEGIKDVLDEKERTEDERKLFSIQDAKAKALIIQGVSDKHLDIIKDAVTARAMMKSLQDVFVRSTSFTKLTLWRKLLNLKCGRHETLEDHFLKFDTITRELEDLGSKIDETDRICHLLLSLPEVYDTVITALETVKDLKMDFVKARLLDEETKIKSKGLKNKDNTEVSFKSSNNGCYNCGDKGHFKAQCPKPNKSFGRGRGRGRGYRRGAHQQTSQKSENANQISDEISFVALECREQAIKDNNVFIIDSGASNSLVKEELVPYMTEITNLDHEIVIHIANGDRMVARKKGKIRGICQGKILNIEALIVPSLKHNLLSAAKLTEKGHSIVIEQKQMRICGENFVLACKHVNGLYVLRMKYFEPNQCLVTSSRDENIWHRRLGHLGRDGLKQLKLPYSDKQCTACAEGKATRLPFYRQNKRSNHIGELIHSDISGPVTPPTQDEEKYFQVIVDDYSHFIIVKLLKNKDEAEGNLMNYIAEVERQHGVKVKRLRLDNGGEFTSNNFKSYAQRHGLKLEYTMSYSPQMGGKAERANRTLLNMVRTKISESEIPKYLWGEAIKCAAYELNRSPTSTLKRGQTPALLWHRRNDISKLKIFGSRAWLVTMPKGNKLDPRAKRTVMIGYCGGG